MSKKLEEFGHEAKADLGALQKKCQAFEIENKELKKEVKTLAERMDRDNEKNKQNLDKLTKDILMVVKMASKLTNNQKKLETENQEFNSQLQHLREVIGIDNAMKGLSISNDSSYNNKKEEANKTN
jgi:predicted  nucleic acid-binding Zn-ribbon protein